MSFPNPNNMAPVPNPNRVIINPKFPNNFFIPYLIKFKFNSCAT